MNETRETIDFGKLTDQQTAFLECVEWHLEAFPGDVDRLRVVYPTIKAVSRWFSRNWKPITWDFIRPS
jgi:hypothetical protein